MNEVYFQLFVYGFKFTLSLKKRAYLKYDRVLLYSNDTAQHLKDWIIVMSSEKGYRLLSYYTSVLKENIHLIVKLRYCEAV